MSIIRKLLCEIARAGLFVFVVAIGNLIALYIVAGIAFHGDWDRVDSAIERAYDEYFNDN